MASKAAAKAAPVTSGEATVTASKGGPPSRSGEASVTASSEHIGGNAGSYEVSDTREIDWESEVGGGATSWEGEGGVDLGTGKVNPKEREAGEGVVTDPDDEIRTADADDDDGAADDEPARQAATKEEKTRAERRAAVLRALKVEKKNRPLEDEARARTDEARTLREQATALQAQLDKVRKGSLAERLAAIGMTREELADEVIMNGGDAAAVLPPKGNRPDPVLVELQETVKALQAKLTKKDEDDAKAGVEARANEARQIARGIITEGIKGPDGRVIIAPPVAPLVKGLKAEDRVIRAAWQTWKANKEVGNVSDYIPAAAEVVEEYLEREHPELAELKKANRAAQAAREERGEETAPRSKAKTYPAVGSRMRPQSNPSRGTKLSMDGDERTRQIIAEMGMNRR